MALLTRWTWVWTNSRTWWWTGKPGMLISLSIMPLRFIQYVVFISSLLLFWTSSICSVVSDSATPWTATHQAYLSITNFQSLLKLMSIEAVIPSNHLILCHPLLFLPSIFPSIKIFSNESILCISSQSIGVSASAFVLQMNIQDWFPLGWSGWISLLSKGLSRVISGTIVQKDQFFSAQFSL